MIDKKLFSLFVFTGVLLVFAISLISAENNFNITVGGGITNASLYTHSNMTVVLNFTILNGTTLVGTNWTYVLDGTQITLCNSTAVDADSPGVPPGTNASGCLGDGVINTINFNLSE